MTMKSLFAAAGAAALLAGPVSALAQDDLPPPAEMAPPPAEMAPAPAGAGDVTDTEVDQFASALERVDEIMIQASEQMQTGLDTEQQAALETQVQSDLVEAVESSGLSVERYNELAMAAHSDPELANRVAARLE